MLNNSEETISVLGIYKKDKNKDKIVEKNIWKIYKNTCKIQKNIIRMIIKRNG